MSGSRMTASAISTNSAFHSVIRLGGYAVALTQRGRGQTPFERLRHGLRLERGVESAFSSRLKFSLFANIIICSCLNSGVHYSSRGADGLTAS